MNNYIITSIDGEEYTVWRTPKNKPWSKLRDFKGTYEECERYVIKKEREQHEEVLQNND
jgi:hypothetical protein